MNAPLRILIIDDDNELCQLVADYLGPMGFQVESEHEGESGIHITPSRRGGAGLQA